MNKTLRNKKDFRNQLGMTLVEIMIVLAILGGLAAILGTTVIGALDKAKVRQAKTQISEIIKRLEIYNTDCNTYPSTEQGLKALVQEPEGEPSCSGGGWGPQPYYKKEPKDPWGNAFDYSSDGIEFTIISLGKDKREGGDGYNKDITSDDL